MLTDREKELVSNRIVLVMAEQQFEIVHEQNTKDIVAAIESVETQFLQDYNVAEAMQKLDELTIQADSQQLSRINEIKRTIKGYCLGDTYFVSIDQFVPCGSDGLVAIAVGGNTLWYMCEVVPSKVTSDITCYDIAFKRNRQVRIRNSRMPSESIMRMPTMSFTPTTVLIVAGFQIVVLLAPFIERIGIVWAMK